MNNFVSDTRFTLIGIGLIFVGFIVLGVFGPDHSASSIEAEEFENCFEYFEDRSPVPVSCDSKLLDRTTFFALVIALLGSGIFSLIKGVKGKWDQDIRPEDMVGPGGENSHSDKTNSEKKDE